MTGNTPRAPGRLAIIAGNGFLPLHVAAAARAAGEHPLVIELKGESAGRFPGFDSASIGVGDVAGLQALFRRHGVDRVVLSGGVRRRPAFSELRPTLGFLLSVPSVLKKLKTGGDDAVLQMVIGLIESGGPRVIGAHEIAPDLLAEAGALGKCSPDAEARRDMAAAAEAATALGALDIGQGAVACGGRVVALEGPEGTEQMLARVAALKAEGRISPHRRGVLVKLAKPQQDIRADLPSIGPSTVAQARAAGLSGVAVESGLSLVLERDATIAAADAAGLFLYGLDRELDAEWIRRA